MKFFNLGRFFMPKNPLLDEIETPEKGMETNAYVEIESMLEQKLEDLSDCYSREKYMYAEVSGKLRELMEVFKS